MSAKGDVYGLRAPKRQAILVPQLDFTASSRAEAGDVQHKGVEGNTGLWGALSPALPATWGALFLTRSSNRAGVK